VGARTDAARSEVLAARAGLDEELVRLEASARASVDIPARLRREPAKVIGTAGGAAFLLLGGPKRVVRGVRRAIWGPDAELPKRMLPKEVEKTLRKMGSDGDRVRGTLEREFASYLDEKAQLRRDRDLLGTATLLVGGVLRPVAQRFGKQLAERALDPDAPSFAEGLRRARERLDGMSTGASAPRERSGPPGGSGQAPL
jgi:hypothetical protein